MANPSLRYRLVGLLMSAVSASWVAISLLTYQDARREIDAVLDAHLEQSARLVAQQAGRALHEAEEEETGNERPYDVSMTFQVWDAGGQLVLRSPDAPRTQLSRQARGFADAEVDGRPWRVYSRSALNGKMLVQVAESRTGREQLAARFLAHALWPLAIGLPLIGLLVWIAIGSALRPLRALRDALALRRGPDLSPLNVAAPPSEVAPLVSHLNALFERVRGTLEAERRFTSQAAHELRTPIAGIRAQAESAIGAASDADRRHALERVVSACDRLSRIMTQLLTLARMDEAPIDVDQPCRLDELARSVVADLAPAALKANVELGLVADTAVSISADPLLIEVLLRNLIDNAVRYSGHGCHVEVRIEAAADGARLAVVDDGPGVAERDLAQLGQAFFRGGRTTDDGSGLGLSIVARIARRHGAEVHYSGGANGRGLSAELRFTASGPVEPVS
ncbi:MAG: ATP-binding protein [Pseudomonadota bacterium]